MPDAPSLSYLPHITIQCDQDRIVSLRNSTNELIRRTRNSCLIEANDMMTGVVETLTHRHRYAFIKK